MHGKFQHLTKFSKRSIDDSTPQKISECTQAIQHVVESNFKIKPQSGIPQKSKVRLNQLNLTCMSISIPAICPQTHNYHIIARNNRENQLTRDRVSLFEN